jgi:hypothetical protein
MRTNLLVDMSAPTANPRRIAAQIEILRRRPDPNERRKICEYIESTVQELLRMAENQDLQFLAYLLEVVAVESNFAKAEWAAHAEHVNIKLQAKL